LAAVSPKFSVDANFQFADARSNRLRTAAKAENPSATPFGVDAKAVPSIGIGRRLEISNEPISPGLTLGQAAVPRGAAQERKRNFRDVAILPLPFL
jgi:hypothetical protein